MTNQLEFAIQETAVEDKLFINGSPEPQIFAHGQGPRQSKEVL